MTHTPVRFLQIAALSLLLPTAMAQNPQRSAYLLDGAGQFVGSGTPGQCWHTGSWTPALAVEPCDPVARKVAQAQAPAPTPPAAVPPAEVAPAPAPMAIAPVPRAMPQAMSFAADALFAFDKSTLNPEGKKMLDELAAKLRGTTYQRIQVTGHTDRLGSTAYNQKLSNARATTVRDYLAGTGVARDRIDAQGKGETQPMTLAGSCLGKKSAKVIACLAADRRVAVEVQGTRNAQP